MISGVRAGVYLVTAMVPVLLSLSSDGVVTGLLFAGLAFLAASWASAVGAFEPYEPKATDMLPLEICATGLIVLDALYLRSGSETIQGLQVFGRVLRLALVARYLVLRGLSAATAGRGVKVAVASRIFDATAMRTGALGLAAGAAAMAAAGSNMDSAPVDSSAALLIVLAALVLCLALSAWSLDKELVAPATSMLNQMADSGAQIAQNFDPDGNTLALRKGFSNHIDASPNPKIRNDVAAYASGQLALAATRALLHPDALIGGSNAKSGDKSGKAANSLLGAASTDATVKQVASYDDRVNSARWFPVSTLGDPMGDFMHRLRGGTDGDATLEGELCFTLTSHSDVAGHWDWDVLRLKKREHVLELVERIFEADGLADAFNFPAGSLQKFVHNLGTRYLANYYHNMWHAADVCFTTWHLLHETGAVDWLSHLEQLGALLASYGHDVGHPGVNNMFLVQTQSDLALLHNDYSPLENMHSAILAGVLRDTKLLEGFSPADSRTLRAISISAILGTDMVHHFSQLSDLRVFYEAYGCLMPSHGGSDPSLVFAKDDSKRRFLIDMFVHAADINNPAKEWVACQAWSFLAMDEFWSQGDRERDLGLPVAPMYDRTITNVPVTQMNFAEYLAFPLFLVFAEIFPGLSPLARYLTSNVGKWADLRVAELYAQSESSLNADTNHRNAKGKTSSNKDANLPEGVQLEVKNLLARGPAAAQVLTDALETLIVIRT